LDSIAKWLYLNLQAIYLDDWAGARGLITIFLILAAMILTVVLHELGHVFAGIIAGFRLNTVHLGKIKIDSSLRFSRHRSETLALGLTCFFPKEMRHHAGKYIAMIASGPLANLISGFLVLLLPYQKSLVSGAFVAASFYFGLVNLLPFRTKKIMSDGLQILRVLLKRASHERALALLQLREELKSGIETEALSTDLVADLTAVRDNSLMTVVAYSIAYARAYHQKDYPAAAYCLETCLLFSGKSGPQIRNALIADAAILQARRKKMNLAEQWLAELPDHPSLKSYRLRAEGAIAEEQGNFTQAIAKVEACLREAETMKDEPGRKRLISRLAGWKGELEQSLLKAPGL
jgi:hypothetical protein